MTSQVGFVRLEVTSNAPSELTVRVAGASICVSRGFDPELLRDVVAALSDVRQS